MKMKKFDGFVPSFKVIENANGEVEVRVFNSIGGWIRTYKDKGLSENVESFVTSLYYMRDGERVYVTMNDIKE